MLGPPLQNPSQDGNQYSVHGGGLQYNGDAEGGY
jgi:hypothetical protein